MALRLGSVVTCGEILNIHRNTVHGWFALRDEERPIRLQLTGNCEGDLAGKHFRFEAREDLSSQSQEEAAVDVSNIAWEQVGPTGTMITRQVRTFECSTDEFLLRAKLDEPPPTQWKNCLYLEWYSQNGRVVLEIVDPKLEFVDPDAPEEELDGEIAGQGTVEFEVGSLAAAEGEEVETDALPWDDESSAIELGESDDETEDPYGLFPEELEAQFEEDAFATDRAVLPYDHNEFLEQVELYDEVVSSGDGVPIREIFDPPMRIYPTDELDDQQVAIAFNAILMRLAMHGIALDMCEHYTPREAYRLLVETILVEERTYPKLASRSFVQHYMTHEHCPQCDAEMEAKFEEYQRKRKERGEEDPQHGSSVPEDDIPF